MTTPDASMSTEARLGDHVLHRLEDLLHARLDDLAQSTWRGSTRGARPPTDGTSMVSSSSTIARRAQPYLILIRSASAIGVRSPVAMSFVRLIPPIGMHARVHDRAIHVDDDVGRAAADVDQRDADLLLVLESTAAALASGSSTTSATSRPQRSAHLMMFCALVVAAVTMWTRASSRTPLMPTGSRMPS